MRQKIRQLVPKFEIFVEEETAKSTFRLGAESSLRGLEGKQYGMQRAKNALLCGQGDLLAF